MANSKRDKIMKGKKSSKLSRRAFIGGTSLLAAGLAAKAAAGMGYGGDEGTGTTESLSEVEQVIRNGRINHSVCRWCYRKLSLEQLCAAAAKMGLKSVELVEPGELATVKKYGLVCAMVNSHSLKRGLNNKEYHVECLDKIRNSIDAAADYGFPNVITFSGKRDGIPDDVGLDNAVTAVKQIIGYAEKKRVTICIEILNSKVNHKGYMFDHMNWGIELCKKVGSENLKILYDIYHAQIMEGDVIRTIRDYAKYIGHYHTAGNPGRHEIDETQELYYPAIMRAIVETGFKDYVAQEFIPTRDPLKSLAQAVQICDV